jgi:D-3-phosphoglycerate dehydrogenase
MLTIKTMNKISKLGLDLLDPAAFEVNEAAKNPDAILVRSAQLHALEFNSNLKAIGRAGAGVNNIPIDKCTENNVVVFNTPGANANAVKEIVLGSLILASRNLVHGMEFTSALGGETDKAIHEIVEEKKSLFKGFEIRGKKLGVVGLGSIGMMVANDAVSLGMEVEGHDPFISVHRAWELSRAVKPCENFNKLLAHSDFITFHVSLTPETKGLMNAEAFKRMKKGSVLLNFSRDQIVEEDAVIEALESDHLRMYITDFPTQKLLKTKNVVCLPHLGASTREAEDNCAIMIADQISDFLLNGNISNSVNFPNCSIERSGKSRLVIANKNIPNMVGQITGILASEGLNILEMVNKSRGDLAYNIVDLNDDCPAAVIEKIRKVEGISFVRLIV